MTFFNTNDLDLMLILMVKLLKQLVWYLYVLDLAGQIHAQRRQNEVIKL